MNMNRQQNYVSLCMYCICDSEGTMQVQPPFPPY
jgi:hypothetical protein